MATQNQKPHCIHVFEEGRLIPAELRELDQWVVWRHEMRDDKWTKVPYNPRTLTRADSTDPTTWATFAEALDVFNRDASIDGIGFVFSEDDPYSGVDFDKCIFDGELDPDKQAWVESLLSYTEYSPSETGLHAIVRGVVPGDRRKSVEHGVEMYDSGRFFTFSGLPWGDKPLPIRNRQKQLKALYNELFPPSKPSSNSAAPSSPNGHIPADDEELLRIMFASRNGAEIKRLFEGDTSGHNHDDSSADLALCNHLAFWTDRDAERMDRLFRQSELYRDKWERQDYREGTISKAIAATSEGYTGPRKERSDQQETPASDKTTAPRTDTGTYPYEIKNGRLSLWHKEGRGNNAEWVCSPIADFEARIAQHLVGEDDNDIFVIEGTGVRGGPFTVEIAAKDFGDTGKLIGLLESVSARDGISANHRKHVGPAIKKLSTDVRYERRYLRTGWDDDGRFMIPGRMPDGVRLELPQKLPYAIDADADLSKGLEALTALIKAPGAERGAVLLAHELVGPLAKVAGWHNERYALIINAKSGSMKTTTAQLNMAIYGPRFTDDDTLILLSDGATRNAIVALAAVAHDMPILFDNYKPNAGDGAGGWVNLVHRIMEGGDKMRLDRSSNLRESKALHCWPIFTGEDVPSNDGAALARTLVMQFEDGAGAIERGDLPKAQALSRHLCAVGGAWIEWLESEEGRKHAKLAGAALNERRIIWAQRLRQWAPDMTNPLRVASNLTVNTLAFEVAMQHPTIGPIIKPFADAHAAGLIAIAKQMGAYTSHSLEATRYLEALGELLQSGQAILVTNDPKVAAEHGAVQENEVVSGMQGRVIGWSDEYGGAYLFPKVARKAIHAALGETLGGISDNALYKQLHGLGAIEIASDGRSTVAKKINGKTIRMLHVLPHALNDGGNDE